MKGKTNVLFTMVLFLVFILCALFTVLIGSRIYENINARSSSNFTGSTAVSYIANKVRQGDRKDRVQLRQVGDTQVLSLGQEIDGVSYETWIYYQDGGIRELFASSDSGLGLEDGLLVLECQGLELSLEDRMLTIKTLGEGGGTLNLYLRSGGV